MSTHNLCFGAKIRKIGLPLHTPVLLYKNGVQGVYITRICFPDDHVMSAGYTPLPRLIRFASESAWNHARTDQTFNLPLCCSQPKHRPTLSRQMSRAENESVRTGTSYTVLLISYSLGLRGSTSVEDLHT